MSEADELKLPSGWTLTLVGDLLKFKNGLNKGKAYFGYGTPIVNYMDVFRHTGLRRADVQGLVDVTNAEKQAFSARKGDVLFTRTSETPEEVGISTVLLEDIEDAVYSGFVLRGRPVNARLTPEFAQYCFDSRFVRGQIVSSATYTTRALTNGRILSNVKLPLPDGPDEQQAIAAALSDADGVVVGLERVIAKKRLIKQGAMQDLLTARRRLPGFSGEWEVKRLGEVAQIVKGQLITSSTIVSGQIPVVAGGKQPAYFHAHANRSGPVVTISASGASAGYVAYYESDIFASDCSTISLGQGYDLRFIYALLVSAQEKIYRAQTGGAQPHIHPRDVASLIFKFPKVPEQQAIAAVLSDMDAEIQTLESHLAKARAVKEGMMQNLLTGRVRLV